MEYRSISYHIHRWLTKVSQGFSPRVVQLVVRWLELQKELSRAGFQVSLGSRRQPRQLFFYLFAFYYNFNFVYL